MSTWTEPEGLLVSTTPALLPSPEVILGNSLPPTYKQSATLVPLVEEHIPALYLTLGGPQNAHLYRYLNLDPPGEDSAAFTAWLKNCMGLFFNYTIFKKTENEVDGLGEAVGIIALINPVPSHRRIEIGILFGDKLQRTTAATEVFYLLLKYVFEELGYRRLEWKANSFNESSVKCAKRLGFVMEGVFRNHMILRGRSRDSVWLSAVDGDWEVLKVAFEWWLEESNFEGGVQRRRLEDVREEVKEKTDVLE
jgi:RimJ/RimL family protein N-acetyltransferase